MNQSLILDTLLSFKDDMYRVALGIMGKPEDAEPIVFEAIDKIYLNHKKIKDIKFLKTYTIRTVINLCKDTLKKRRIYIEYDDNFSIKGSSQDFNFVHDYIDKLPTNLKELIVLHYITGFTFDEIADITQTPSSTIKSRIKKALTLLRVEMEDIYESWVR